MPAPAATAATIRIVTSERRTRIRTVLKYPLVPTSNALLNPRMIAQVDATVIDQEVGVVGVLG